MSMCRPILRPSFQGLYSSLSSRGAAESGRTPALHRVRWSRSQRLGVGLHRTGAAEVDVLPTLWRDTVVAGIFQVLAMQWTNTLVQMSRAILSPARSLIGNCRTRFMSPSIKEGQQ